MKQVLQMHTHKHYNFFEVILKPNDSCFNIDCTYFPFSLSRTTLVPFNENRVSFQRCIEDTNSFVRIFRMTRNMYVHFDTYIEYENKFNAIAIRLRLQKCVSLLRV